MPSRRGNVSQVITFNFDDLIEVYLSHLGFCVETIVYDSDNKKIMPEFSKNADITVYHPHGILPSISNDERSPNIIFAESDFKNIVNKSGNTIWQQILKNVLSTKLCLFIGVSATDKTLQYVLPKARDSHAAKKYGFMYWGVRFSCHDGQKDFWKNQGIFLKNLGDYKNLPIWLFEISQLAAERIKKNNSLES